MVRNRLVAGFVVVVAVAFFGGRDALAAEAAAPNGGKVSPSASKADDVLKQLLAGNERFVKGELQHPRRTPADFQAVAGAQFPVAVVVACADSRVSPELMFDMGVGDLFVVRVAGNVVDGAGVTVKGSIEYGVAELKAPLIIVMGHSNCGAVKAAVTHIDHKDSLPGAINGLVELIKPAVLKVHDHPGDVYANVTRENVRLSVEKLKNLQPIIAPAVKNGSVKVVGGIYDLHTGKVELIPLEQK